MVGGATASGPVYAGLASPIASHQCLIMGALTGSRPLPPDTAGRPSYSFSRAHRPPHGLVHHLLHRAHPTPLVVPLASLLVP